MPGWATRPLPGEDPVVARPRRVREDGQRLESPFRRARADDAAALAELICLAGESPGAKGLYEVFFGGDRDFRLERVRRLVRARTRTHFSYVNFFVAEVDGIAAAAACGFDPRIRGREKIVPALRETGWSASEIGDAMERLDPVLTCLAEEPQNTWILEHVATLPRFRGRGFAEGVVSRVIEDGFAAGCGRVQVSLFLGNDIARKFYVKLGFKPAGQPRTDRRFEKVMGTPGTESLVLDRREWIESPSRLVLERTTSERSPRVRPKLQNRPPT